jgi:hypothetical protein
VTVGGNVAIRSCTGPLPSGYDGGVGVVTIGGNFLCQSNSARCFARTGSIGGNANISDNSGGTSLVAGNKIDGNLLCFRNTGGLPAVTNDGSPNKVAGKELGQCTGI